VGRHLLDEPDSEYTHEDPLVNALGVIWRYCVRALLILAPVIKWALILIFSASALYLAVVLAALGWRYHQVQQAAPLREAARQGDLERGRELLEAGADPQGIGWKRDSAFTVAVVHGRPEFACLLLERGAEPSEWAIEDAERHGYPELAEMARRQATAREAEEGPDEAGNPE